jgi:dTDP-4-dehydrorhamnose reductase
VSKVLVVGANSKIGRDFIDTSLRKNRFSLWGTLRKHAEGPSLLRQDRLIELDITSRPYRQDIKNHGFDAIVLCAAMTNIRDCEVRSRRSQAVNTVAPLHLARELAHSSTQIIFLSTNMVFDGGQPFAPCDSRYSPMTTYGYHKAKAEELLCRYFRDQLSILRLTKVISTGFATTADWARELSHGKKIKAFTDYKIAPIELEYVSNIIDVLISRKQAGVFQASGDREYSYYDIAMQLTYGMGVSANNIIKAGYEETFLRYPPIYSSLESNIRERLGVEGRRAWETIDRHINGVVKQYKDIKEI